MRLAVVLPRQRSRASSAVLIPRFFEGELAGAVKIGGRDVTDMSEELTAAGCVAPATRSQFFTTDTTSGGFYQREHGNAPRRDARPHRAVLLCSRRVRLPERSIFSRVSGGEKQRIAIGSAHALPRRSPCSPTSRRRTSTPQRLCAKPL